jgi:hypothetical protein
MIVTEIVRIIFLALDKLLTSSMGFDDEIYDVYDDMYKYHDHQA